MRYEFGPDEWVELADDADLSLGEWRRLWRCNDIEMTDDQMNGLVIDLVNPIVVGGNLLDKHRKPITMPGPREEYERLPRRKWLWLYGKVLETYVKNQRPSKSE